MDEKTKRKYDRLVNWALVVSLLAAVLASCNVAAYRAKNEALKAEVQRLRDSPPQRCPATIQYAFRRVI